MKNKDANAADAKHKAGSAADAKNKAADAAGAKKKAADAAGARKKAAGAADAQTGVTDAAKSPTRRVARNSLFGLAFVLIFVSVIFANHAFSKYRSATKYGTWVKTQATVIECLNERTGAFPTGIGHDRQIVTCQYSSAGQVVRTTFRNAGWKYHKGNLVEVRFNPFQPGIVVVDPAAGLNEAQLSGIGFSVFFLAGFLLLFVSLRKAKAGLQSEQTSGKSQA